MESVHDLGGGQNSKPCRTQLHRQRQTIQLRHDFVERFYLRPRPLSAIAPDLTTAGGWAHLYAMGRAALKTA